MHMKHMLFNFMFLHQFIMADEKVKKVNEPIMSNFDPEKNYLKVNKCPPSQTYACISILGPDTKFNKYDERLIKVRGVFNTKKKATIFARRLNKLENNVKVNIYIIQVGYWTPCFSQKENIDLVKALNKLMYNKISEHIHSKAEFEKRKQDMMDNKLDPSEGYTGGQMQFEKDVDPEKYKDVHKMPTKHEEASDDEDEDEDITIEEETSNDNDQVNNEMFINKVNEHSSLSCDAPIKGQNWCCMSFISPVNKEVDFVYGFKLHGIFDTIKECEEHISDFTHMDRIIHTFIAPCGKWVKWDPNEKEVKNQRYYNDKLNELFNAQNAKNATKFQDNAKEKEMLENLEKNTTIAFNK